MEVYFDERSDEWPESERGEAHEDRTDALEEIAGALEAIWMQPDVSRTQPERHNVKKGGDEQRTTRGQHTFRMTADTDPE
jgi:hypothetical protein